MNFGMVALNQSMGIEQNYVNKTNCDENDKRPLPIGMNKKLLGFFKD